MPYAKFNGKLRELLVDDDDYYSFKRLHNTVDDMIGTDGVPFWVKELLSNIRCIGSVIDNLYTGEQNLSGPFPEKYGRQHKYFVIVERIANDFVKIVTGLLYDAGLYADGIRKKPEDIYLNLDLDNFMDGTYQLAGFMDTLNETVGGNVELYLNMPKEITEARKEIMKAYCNPHDKKS